MKRTSGTISLYLIRAILPYFIFSWLLLSVILFVQQAGRFSDIFFSVNIPAKLVWQLTLALIPNVIGFTCPMAVLVGTIIGLSKMQGDSELVAIRAAGVGNLQITAPIIVLGILLSLFAFFVNLKGVPFAARIVRGVALQTAIQKLESPIEPGVFNSEVSGYTIYVKGGDMTNGTWKNIFIYNEDEKSGLVRLITSSHGRIDTTGQLSELVLSDATVSSFPKTGIKGKFISENIGEIRIAIKTKRSELIEKLSSAEGSIEELGLSELSEYANTKEGKERIEAQILWQRRLMLSLTPLIFCLLGTGMVLRFSRGGRGFGIFLALLGLISYFLLAFLGEQLARTSTLTAFEGSLIPLIASAAAIIWFNFAGRLGIFSGWGDWLKGILSGLRPGRERLQTKNLFVDLTTGLRDFDLVLNLLKYFLLTLGFLAVVFLIFTAFELWKFAGTIDNGISLLIKYLIFLLPFVYIQLAPSAAMIATLATYVIKSRQNEIVTWTSAGQSVYRLLLPCFVLMCVLGLINFEIQEHILPRSNQIQDALRSQIRSQGVVANRSGKFWVATDKRIYSFELGPASDNEKPDIGSSGKEKRISNSNKLEGTASDNEKDGMTPVVPGNSVGRTSDKQTLTSDNINRKASSVTERSESDRSTDKLTSASDNVVREGQTAEDTNHTSISTTKNIAPRSASDNAQAVQNLTVYEFNGEGSQLSSIYTAPRAAWEKDRIVFLGDATKVEINAGKPSTTDIANGELADDSNPFTETVKKPSYLTIGQTREQIAHSESDVEQRTFAVSLEKKFSTLFLPFIIALFTAPFALSLSRKGKVITVGYAVGLWLLFMGVTNVFEQFGLNGFLAPAFAVWTPLMLFSMLGIYLLSRVKT